MDAETRAALEWAINLGKVNSNSDWTRGHIVALEGLLGGGANGHQLAGSSAPDAPDSLAKIAADLRMVANAFATYDDWTPEYKQMLAIAARIEALGLEPSERETVKKAIEELEPVLDHLTGYRPFQDSPHRENVNRAIAALTPIAERKP